MDSLTVTREQFRLAKNDELEFLAQALGNVTGAYTTENVVPTAVVLQGTPTLAAGAEPGAAQNDLRLANARWSKRFSCSPSTTAPASPVDGQPWVDLNLNPPQLKVWDDTGSAWVLAVAVPAGTANQKFSIANDDADLSGGGTTAAINAALIANGDIANVGALGVSDQVEITVSGNADANANVTAGYYFWDGTSWWKTIEANPTDDPPLTEGGGAMSGSITVPERVLPVNNAAWDLSTGPYWSFVGGIIEFPNAGVVAGMTGTIRVTGAITGWQNTTGAATGWQFIGGAADAPGAITTPAIIPFYVRDAGTIMVGRPVENIVS